MGDMADMLIGDGPWDLEEGDDFGGLQPSMRPITCRYCQTTGLHWDTNEDGKWRLYTKHGIHCCRVAPLPEKPKPRVITDPVEKAFYAGFDLGYKSAMNEACPDIGPGCGKITAEDAYRNYIK